MSHIHIGEPHSLSTTHSPVTLSPNVAGSSRVRSRSISSTQLQSEVESERAEVLSDVKSAQSSQFGKVDSLSQRLEDTNSYAMDVFKRDIPATTTRSTRDVEDDDSFGDGAADDMSAPTTSIVISSPTASPHPATHATTASGKSLPVDSMLKEMNLPAATATNEDVLLSSSAQSDRLSASISAIRPSAITTSPVVVSQPYFPSEDRDRVLDYLPVRSSAAPTSSPRTPPSRNSPTLSSSTITVASSSPNLSPRVFSSEPMAVPTGDGAVRRNSLNELHEHVTQHVTAMDSMAQQLEAQSSSTQDMFRRELPVTVAGSSETVEGLPVDRLTASNAVVITTPASTATTASTHSRLPADVTLVKTVTASSSADPIVSADSLRAPTSLVIPEGSTTSVATPVSSIQPAVPYTTTDYPTAEDDATPHQQIQQLSIALIQAKQAYHDLLNKLYSSTTNTSLIGVDTRPVEVTPTAMLSAVGTDDRSVQSFLHDLPVHSGWLLRRRPATANVPASVEQVYCSLSFDGLLISDNERGENAEKIELARYWLIERAADRNASTSSNTASAGTLSAFNVPTSPVAGQSYFRLENGSYVLRLVPIIRSAEHPQTVLEPSSSSIIEFLGATDADLTQPDTLSQWCNAINLRISLLSLLASPNHSNLLAQGGREVLTFLCDVNATTLLVENKYVNVSELITYFKEPLLHRRHFSLTLRNVAMDDGGARVLSELLLLNNSIQHVDISYNRVTDTGASYLAMALPSNDGLIGLTLDYNQFTDDGVLELVNAVAASASLTSLSFRGLHLTDSTFASLVSAMRSGVPRALMKFDASFNSLTDASASAVGELLRAFGVGSLNLSHNNFGEALLSAIDSSLSPDSDSRAMLTVLDVSYNSLTTTSPAALSSLLASNRTLSVNLSGNGLSSSSVVSLLTAGTEVAVDGLRIHRGEEDQAASNARPLPLGRRLSITKSNVIGRVDEINTLHPRSDKQLGRTLHELSSEDKSNNVRSEDSSRPLTSTQHVRGVEKELLDVPSTAASTEMLFDGGKTADPRLP